LARAKPEEEDEVEVEEVTAAAVAALLSAAAADEAGGAAADEAAAAGAAAAAAPDEVLGVPGEVTKVFNCTPLATGPDGFAGHEPAGLRGVVCPKGIVAVPPTATPPTKVAWLEPWNWHWKNPSSSLF